MIDKDDQFQYWLADMHDAIERFRAVVASSGGGSLDMTPASLLALEAMLLERYASVEQSRAATNASFIDGAARYVGQTFRHALGGKWFIDNVDSKNAFFGLPQLGGMNGQQTQICPLTLVTSSLARRTGNHVYKVLMNLSEQAKGDSDRS
jgi:hypothetical protein